VIPFPSPPTARVRLPSRTVPFFCLGGGFLFLVSTEAMGSQLRRPLLPHTSAVVGRLLPLFFFSLPPRQIDELGRRADLGFNVDETFFLARTASSPLSFDTPRKSAGNPAGRPPFFLLHAFKRFLSLGHGKLDRSVLFVDYPLPFGICQEFATQLPDAFFFSFPFSPVIGRRVPFPFLFWYRMAGGGVTPVPLAHYLPFFLVLEEKCRTNPSFSSLS